jgi:tetratricopeptide (TPR) repeat protein
MRWFNGIFHMMFIGMIIGLAAIPAKSFVEKSNSNSFVSRIEGTVWSPDRQPVSDIYVELQNELLSTISRVRTSSSGRFSFTGIALARYVVKVLPGSTNYLEYSENVDLVGYTDRSTGRTTSDTVYLDIYLKLDNRKINTGGNEITEAIFVQEIPEQARKLYNNGIKDIIRKNEKGFDEIEQALKIFPDYFDALNLLGREYTERKEYQKALPYLVRSIEINRRSFSSLYALAYACYQLNHRPEALQASAEATILQPNSVNAQLLYGTLLRLDGKYENAEKVLLKAKNLSKNTPVAEIHWQLALLYNRLGRNKAAAEELETYLKIKPDAVNKKEIMELIAKLRKEVK